jgi:hypothetical protein
MGQREKEGEIHCTEKAGAQTGDDKSESERRTTTTNRKEDTH